MSLDDIRKLDEHMTVEQRLATTERERDAAVQEAQRLRQALEVAKVDGERLDWLESEMEREQRYLHQKGLPYHQPLFRRNMPITRAAIDIARAKPEAGNGG